MTASNEELELKDRLSLIETMIAEGRRTTSSWGWTFVFWGVAYYVAIVWTAYQPMAIGLARHHDGCLAAVRGHHLAQAEKQPQQRPGTTIGRAISSIWFAMGMSLLLLLAGSRLQRPASTSISSWPSWPP